MPPQTDKTTPATQKPGDHPNEPATKPADHAKDALQQQSLELRAKTGSDAPKLQPQKVDVAEVSAKLGLTIKPGDLSIVGGLAQIKESTAALVAQMRNPSADAKTVADTQARYKTQVHDAITAATDLSKPHADGRPIDRITDSLAKTVKRQEELEAKLSVDAKNQKDVLKTLLTTDPSKLSQDQKDYIGVMTMAETLRRAQNSASLTNAIYGSAVSNGLIGDLSHRQANGMATPTTADISEAYSRLGMAHRLAPESRVSPGLEADYARVTDAYKQHLTDIGRNTAENIQKASALFSSNPAAAENFLTVANKTADTNIQSIKQQLADAKDKDPAMAAKLQEVLKVFTESRLEYGSFLVQNGRLAEASEKLSKAGSESKDAVGDPSYAQLGEMIKAKAIAQDGSITTWQKSFADALKDRNWTTADIAIKHIQDETNARIKVSEDGKKAAMETQRILTEELAKAKTDTEKVDLNQQIQQAKERAVAFDTQKALDNRNLAFTSYQAGFVHMSDRKMADAHADFEKIAALDPILAKELNDHPPEGLGKLNDLVDQTKEPSWWQSHWRTVAGIGIGILATAAVIATGGAALPAVAIVLAGGGLYAAAGATAGETSGKQILTNFGVGCAITGVSVLLKGVPMWRAGQVAAQAATTEAASVALSTTAGEGLKTVVTTATGSALTETTKAALTNAAATETTKAVVTQVVAGETTKAVVTQVVAGETTKAVFNGVVQEGTKDAAVQAAGWGSRLMTGVASTGTQTLKNFIAVPTLKQLSQQTGVAVTGLGMYEGVWKMGVKGETVDQVLSHLPQDALAAAVITRTGASAPFMVPALDASGINALTTAGGYGMAAVPQFQNYYNGKKTFDQAVAGTLTDGGMNSMFIGVTANALTKNLGTGMIDASGNLVSKSALAFGTAKSYMPYAIQEGLMVGVDKGFNLSGPLDPTKEGDNELITQNWIYRYESALPDSAPTELPLATDPALTDNK